MKRILNNIEDWFSSTKVNGKMINAFTMSSLCKQFIKLKNKMFDFDNEKIQDKLGDLEDILDELANLYEELSDDLEYDLQHKGKTREEEDKENLGGIGSE